MLAVNYSARQNGTGMIQCKWCFYEVTHMSLMFCLASRLAFVTVQLLSLFQRIHGRRICMKTMKLTRRIWSVVSWSRNYWLWRATLFLKFDLQLIPLQAFKAIFTSPSSANEVDGEGDGADIIENNRRARRRSDQAKVKTCVASIIGMRKVTPRAIAYTACQVSIDTYF